MQRALKYPMHTQCYLTKSQALATSERTVLLGQRARGQKKVLNWPSGENQARGRRKEKKEKEGDK